MSLGPVEIGPIVLAVMLLFGYTKLPDASRSLGSSLRIFTSEVGDLRRGDPMSATSHAGERAAAFEGERAASRNAPGVGRAAWGPR